MRDDRFSRFTHNTSLCLATCTYARWQRGTARIRPPDAAAGLLLLAYAETDRRTDTVLLHRPWSAYYAGTANKGVSGRRIHRPTDGVATILSRFVYLWYVLTHGYKKVSYCREIARCVVSVEILLIATQQCRNYLYDKSWTKYQLSLIDPFDKIVQ